MPLASGRTSWPSARGEFCASSALPSSYSLCPFYRLVSQEDVSASANASARLCSIRAIFSWELTDDGDDTRLSHPVITQLPGNPLDVAVAAAAPPKVIVSVDPGEMFQARSLHVLSLTLNEHRLSVESDLTVRDDADADEELDVTEAEVRRLLYTVENLRKQPSEAEASGPADADVVQEEAASL